MKRLVCMLLCSFHFFLMAQVKPKNFFLEIVCDSTPLSKPIPDTIEAFYINKERMPWQEAKSENRLKNNAVWRIQADEPILLSLSLAVTNQYKQWLLEPKDSIVVYYKDGMLRFTGRGAEKLILGNDIASISNSMQKPANEKVFETSDLQDYLEWKGYLNRQWSLVEPLLQSYAGRISNEALTNMKVEYLRRYDYQLTWKFLNLRLPEHNIEKQVLNQIFDEDFYSPQLKWLRAQTSSLMGGHGFFGFNRLQLAREYNFPVSHKNPTESKEEFALRLYENGMKNCSGNALEFAAAEFLTTYIIKDFGFTPFTENLLKRYYNDKDRNAAFKAYVKEFENNARVMKKGTRIPAFEVVDQNGRAYTKANLKGKVLLFHFWKSGDQASSSLARSLQKVERIFKNDTDVVFLHISADKDRNTWLKSVAAGIYTTGGGVNAFAGAAESNSNMIRQYNINTFPAIMLVSLNGVLLNSSLSDTLKANEGLIDKLKQYSFIAKRESWQANTDGPYVLYDNNKGKVYTFMNASMKAEPLTEIKNKEITVATDVIGQTFNVRIKDRITKEPAVFPQPEKLIALSDIEGNFDAFRILLQKNNVIDNDFNWTFGKGHLVFIGDMFDRGEQVTECLWLLYSLEEKAKAVGGFVHFILGNHELMNLEGNFKYVRSKYKLSAEKIGLPLTQLYGDNSELGKWLRTKNIIEKIGDILFLHAGISKEVNDLKLTIEQINELSRPYYDNSTAARQSKDGKLALLYDNQLSPFWYRNYYLSTEVNIGLAHNKQIVKYKTKERVIDEILSNYGASKIVTGHSVYSGVKEEEIGRYVTIHYGGKVINTDTRHAEDKSEALLIERSKYFRVNKHGKQQDLFSLDEKDNVTAAE